MTDRTVRTDDGQAIAIRVLDAEGGPDGGPDGGPATATAGTLPVAVLIHATLSTSDQLMGLARRLTSRFRVLLVDRRGSGASSMADPRPVPVARHADDVVAVLDALGIDRALVVGHSFGGVVALRVAADHPGRCAGVIAWEPPYLAVADERLRTAMAVMADEVVRAYAADGPEAAARRFLSAVSGDDAWERLHPRQREAIARQGGGALADVAMPGLTVDGLERIEVATTIATGDASDAFYAPIADALAATIGPNATRAHLAGLAHMAPITDAAIIADLVLRLTDSTPTTETIP